jgi:hypothetical protein
MSDIGIDSNVMQPHTRILLDIPRWVIIRTIKQQSLAEHQYFVSLYATYIARQMESITIEQIHYVTIKALTHDFEEMITGDTPSPTKKILEFDANVKLRDMCSAPNSMAISISSVETPINVGFLNEIINCADLFEACMFLADEVSLGNTGVKELLDNMTPRLEAKGNALKHGLGIELKNMVVRGPRRRTLYEGGLK